MVGSAYSTTVNASGGTTPRTFTATGLPPGLSIGTSSGTISGTPSTAGTFSVGVTVTDFAGATDVHNYTVTIAPTLAITGPANLSNWTVNRPYTSVTATATGGTPGYTWSATNLPTGLSMSTAGVISGTPTATGTKSVTVTVTDSLGRTTNRSYNVTINPALVIDLTLSMQANKNGQSAQLVTGGTPGYTLSAGTLPFGTFNSATGQITVSGKTPSSPPASYTFPVTVTDSGGGSVSGTVTITMT
jgi:hypothetical protein